MNVNENAIKIDHKYGTLWIFGLEYTGHYSIITYPKTYKINTTFTKEQAQQFNEESNKIMDEWKKLLKK